MSYAQDGKTGLSRQGVSTRSPSAKKGKKFKRPPASKTSTGQPITSHRHVSLNPVAIDNINEVISDRGGQTAERVNSKMRPDTGILSRKSGPIRVEIASAGGIRNQQQHDTVKTTSHQREYSMEDGGIFEKRTIIANTSIEEAKLAGDSLTQQSLEIVQGPQSHSDIIEIDIQSHQ